jgi:hypothetical protein
MDDVNNYRLPPPLPAQDHARLRRLILRFGERGLCEKLGIRRSLLSRAAAGLPIREASSIVIKQRLDEFDASERREVRCDSADKPRTDGK